MLVRSGAVDVVVVDSVAALVPKAEIEGDMGEASVGAQARLMSQALRKLTASIHRSNSMVVFINQLRMKIGVMFGSPETTSGGNALKFYASIRLDIRRIGAIKKGEEVIGSRHEGEGREEQAGAPLPRGRVRHPLRAGHLAAGRAHRHRLARSGIVGRAAPGSRSRSERIGQGRDSANAYLDEHPEMFERLRLDILGRNGIGVPVSTGKPAEG